MLPERRLGAITLDDVMADRSSAGKDYLFEVKYIRVGFRYGWLHDNAMKIIYAAQAYAGQLKRRAIPVLVVVLAQATANSDNQGLHAKTINHRERLRSNLSERGLQAKVVIMREADLRLTNCAALKAALAD